MWRRSLAIVTVGAALQFAVALGGAAWGIWKTDPRSGIRGEGDSNLIVDNTRWGVVVYESPAFVRVHAWRDGGTFPKVPAYIPRFAIDVEALSKRAGRTFFTIVRVGWPFSSFEALATVDAATPTGLVGRGVNGVLVGPQLNVTGLRVLPYGPLPIGIVGNTLFWSLILWGALRARLAIRQRRRLRRGRCPACGHTLGPDAASVAGQCSECGWSSAEANR